MSPCELWAGNVGNRGYGRVYGGKNANGSTIWTLAHREAYEAAYGAIPEGHHAHHTCGVSLCVNPEHLAVLTPSEHARHHNPPPPHCKYGHTFTPENTWVSRLGHRYCRRCKADRMARYRLESLAELAS